MQRKERKTDRRLGMADDDSNLAMQIANTLQGYAEVFMNPR